MPVQSNRSEAIVHLDSTVTLKRWEQMSGAQLDHVVRGSISEIQALSRLAQVEARERLLSALQEIKRRFKAGEKVAGYDGIEEYFHSIGVNPNTVRQWEFRIRQRNLKELPELSKTDDDAEDIIPPPTLREPTTELDGFALDTFTFAEGNKGHLSVFVMPSRHAGFYFVTRCDYQSDGDTVVEGTVKPIRKDGVVLAIERMNVVPGDLKWEVQELSGGCDRNIWLPDQGSSDRARS